MPKITAINQQAKRQDRYSIFVDDKYAFSLSSSQLIDSAIATGDDLEPKRIVELVDISGFGKMLDRAYNYLSYRPRSKKELADYLIKKGCDQPTIEKILSNLIEQGFLDDRSFAETWVSERREYQLRSRRQLEHELRLKGIDKDLIELSLGELPTDEVTTIVDLIRKKSLDRKYGNREKLMNYLSSKGFRYNDIRAALKQLKML